mgnify:CR=1 FL=1
MREITTGIWEDMAWGDISRRYPHEHRQWEQTPWDLNIPGGSTFQQVADRLIECIRRIAQEVGEGTALAVSHSCGKVRSEFATFSNGTLSYRTL